MKKNGKVWMALGLAIVLGTAVAGQGHSHHKDWHGNGINKKAHYDDDDDDRYGKGKGSHNRDYYYQVVKVRPLAPRPDYC